MSEEDARRDLELMLAKDVDKNDPMIDQFMQFQRHIRVSVRFAPPGVGKTRSLMKDWAEWGDFRKLFLSHSHELLSEQYRRMKDVIAVRHLYGLSRICPCIVDEESKDFNEVIATLAELGLTNKYICNACKTLDAYPQEQCPYHLQFKNLPNTIFAPIEYVFTNLIDDYKPNFIAVDDCLLRIRKHHTLQTLERMLWEYQKQFYGNYWREHEDNFIKTLRELFSLNERDYLNIFGKLMYAHENLMKTAASMIITSPEDKLYPFITTSPMEIDVYRKYAAVHGYKDRFATPAIFPLFDYVFKTRNEGDEAQLKIIEAISKQEILDCLRTRYWDEEKTNIHFFNDGFEWEVNPTGSIIYQCLGKEGSWYPAQQLTKSPELMVRMQRFIGWVLKDQPKDKLGLVRPLQTDLENFIPKDSGIMAETLTFGNLRGENKLEHCNPGFVVGSYTVNHGDVIEDFKLFTARDPTSAKYEEKGAHGDWYHFKDKELDAFRWYHEEYEQIQAIFRYRPLQYKKLIYVIGLVPLEIFELQRYGLKIELLPLKMGGGRMDVREQWLLEFVKERGMVTQSEATHAMADKFNITIRRAYEEVLKIRKQNKDVLRAEWDKGVYWLTYIGKK